MWNELKLLPKLRDCVYVIFLINIFQTNNYPVVLDQSQKAKFEWVNNAMCFTGSHTRGVDSRLTRHPVRCILWNAQLGLLLVVPLFLLYCSTVHSHPYSLVYYLEWADVSSKANKVHYKI